MLRLLDRMAQQASREREWLHKPFLNWNLSEFMPELADIETVPVNVYTSDESVRVHLSLPGWDPAWIDLSVEGQRLHIKGETPEDQTRKTFSRVINLPFRVEPDQVKATFKNGILTVDLSKSELDKPRKIEIDAA